MFHRITVPIDDNSSWDKTYNETQILSVEPSADDKKKFLFSLQLKSEKVSFHYNEIAVMMEDYANLVLNVGNGFQSTHTILHATEVSSNGKTLLG